MEKKKIVFKVPPQGSLGLLALGHRGVIAWRKARQEAEENTEETEEDNG